MSKNPIRPVDTVSTENILVNSDGLDATPVDIVHPTDLVEALAESLHNDQVDQLRKQAEASGVDPSSFSFSTWHDLTEASRESRRSTARFLIERFTITAK